jgi:hypothetical protein
MQEGCGRIGRNRQCGDYVCPGSDAEGDWRIMVKVYEQIEAKSANFILKMMIDSNINCIFAAFKQDV